MNLAEPAWAYLAVFLAGLAASVSPCVLAMLPLIIGFVGGYSEGDLKRSALFALSFSLGLAITFTALGALAAMTGRLMGDLGGYSKYILSAVLIIMGLQLAGAIRLNIPQGSLPRIKFKGLPGAMLLGLFFGALSSPCATPVLAAVLAFVASRQNLAYGVMLLFTYALAHTAVILVVGISTGAAGAIVRSRRVQRFSSLFQRISGVVLALYGLFVVWYY
ncbi:MAG TPA: cytochrome c biogenesis protein CcdA [Candidatus Omnitrophota bacterium]|nr:cytochrome c biogenesis protein CcdA [Candidatus Omnitrophota bacterium]